MEWSDYLLERGAGEGVLFSGKLMSTGPPYCSDLNSGPPTLNSVQERRRSPW